jgi:hypothetical protein
MLLNICSRSRRMQCSRIKQHNCRSVIDEKYTNHHVWSFLHCDMIDLLMNVVLLGSNRNRIGSMGRHRGGHSCLRRAGKRIGALVGRVASLPTSIAFPFTQYWILSSLSPLNTLIHSSRGLENAGALIHLTLWGGKSLSSCLRHRLKLRLSRTEHRSS